MIAPMKSAIGIACIAALTGGCDRGPDYKGTHGNWRARATDDYRQERLIPESRGHAEESAGSTTPRER
jgi:hypothetical protein